MWEEMKSEGHYWCDQKARLIYKQEMSQNYYTIWWSEGTVSARNSTRLCVRLYSSSAHNSAYLVFDKERPVFSSYKAARTNIDSCL